CQRPANLPMVTVGVLHAPYPPTVPFRNRINFRGAGIHSLRENGVRICNRQDDSDGRPAESLWAKVAVLGRFIAQPNIGTIHGKSGHYSALAIQTIDLLSAERQLVELHGLRTLPHG